MNKNYNISKKSILTLIYFGGGIGVLIAYLIDKELEKEVKYHMAQCLLLSVLSIITCGLASIILLIFAIMAACDSDIPRLPLISDLADKLSQ